MLPGVPKIPMEPQDLGYSIIVPVKAINDYIIESVPITLKINRTDLEIIILPNDMPTGPLPDFLLDPRVSIVASGKVSPAVKRDLGAKISKYENLAFLDDDAYPRIDWLDEADKAFALSGAEAIGGPGITPLDSSLSELASGLFFETYIGGGGMDYRYRSVGRNFFVDDFPTVNLIVKKAAFDSIGGFDNNYWPGEDTKFCLDFVNAGFKIWYCSDVVVYHHRRTLFRPHLKQVGNYGKHRGYFAKKFPQTSARLTYFAPSIFLVGSILLLLLGIFNAAFLKLYILLMAVYFFIAVLDVFS
ncbi:MAG: glycosyl transferase, partial [Proteobacteria bacterium]|nr:glycosyl transferase [Pseudomonadota bacterium]